MIRIDYWVVRQGQRGIYTEQMTQAGYLGVDFIGDHDIRPYLESDPKEFHAALKQVFLERNPEKSKIAAGLATGNLWVACEGLSVGDVVLAPRPDRAYAFGTVAGGYEYHPGTDLPHRRRVDWQGAFDRDSMSPELARSASSLMTVFSLAPYSSELAQLTSLKTAASSDHVLAPGDIVEEVAFQMERQLEDFLVHNWSNTQLGQEYDIYTEAGLPVGQQYPSDTGPMDILAISKDRTRLLVVELKRDRASDAVVGQIQRYMGYVQDELLEPGQTVEGVIIARTDDLRIKRALTVTKNIRFMKYRVEFHLES